MGEKYPTLMNPELFGQDAAEFFGLQIAAAEAFKVLEPHIQKAIQDPSEANLKALDDTMLKMNPFQRMAFDSEMYLARPSFVLDTEDRREHGHMLEVLYGGSQENKDKIKSTISESITRLEAKGEKFPDTITEAEQAVAELQKKNSAYNPIENSLGHVKDEKAKEPAGR